MLPHHYKLLLKLNRKGLMLKQKSQKLLLMMMTMMMMRTIMRMLEKDRTLMWRKYYKLLPLLMLWNLLLHLQWKVLKLYQMRLLLKSQKQTQKFLLRFGEN